MDLTWTGLDTSCGNRGFGIKEAANNGVMATFTFRLRTGNELESFSIENTGLRSAKNVPTSSDRRAGCGRSITWSSMAPVTLPPELAEAVVNVNTEDVTVVPRAASNVRRMVGRMSFCN